MILQHFDLKYIIWIEIDILGYAIGSELSQLTNLGWWYLVIYYSKKMILAKTCYKTYNSQLLAIVKTFKK